MDQFVYKVCTNYDHLDVGEYCSYIVLPSDKKFFLSYRIGWWTTAPGNSKIFCFNTYEDARAYINKVTNAFIFKCKYRGKRVETWMRRFALADTGKFDYLFWNNNSFQKKLRSGTLPKLTPLDEKIVLVKSVKPVQLVFMRQWLNHHFEDKETECL